jgi:branched-chain amino acid transport system permease protein
VWSQDLTDALSVHSVKVSNNLPLMVYGVVLAVAMLAAPNGVQGVVRRLGSGIKRLAIPSEET